MCIDIFEESRKSYEILHRKIPFLPSRKEIEKYIHLSSQQFSEKVSNIDKMHEIISDFRKQSS